MAIKKRGEKVEVAEYWRDARPRPKPNFKLSSDQEFCDVATKEALAVVTGRVKASIRNQYDGDAKTEHKPKESVITVRLKHKKNPRKSILMHFSVKEEYLVRRTVSHATRLGRNFGHSITLALRAKHEDAYEEEIEQLYEPGVASKSKRPGEFSKVSKPKPEKVCEICGPEDPYYPPWEGKCIHD